MAKNEIVIIADYSQEKPISFEELCEICNLTSDVVRDLIEFEIIHPEGRSPTEWEFDIQQLQRIRTAIRLQHDLEINFAGIAVVLDLLDQLEDLRKRMELLEKHR